MICLVLLHWLVYFFHQLFHQVIAERFSMGFLLCVINIDPRSSALRLSRVPELISDQLKLNILINDIDIRCWFPIGKSSMLIGWLPELIHPHRLRIIGDLSHLIQKSNIIFFPFSLLVQEDIRFLKLIAFAMFLDSHRKGFPQPVQQLISTSRAYITFLDQHLNHIHESFINYGVLHQDELSIRNWLTRH